MNSGGFRMVTTRGPGSTASGSAVLPLETGHGIWNSQLSALKTPQNPRKPVSFPVFPAKTYPQILLRRHLFQCSATGHPVGKPSAASGESLWTRPRLFGTLPPA